MRPAGLYDSLLYWTETALGSYHTIRDFINKNNVLCYVLNFFSFKVGLGLKNM